jgi:hypothetical protein
MDQQNDWVDQQYVANEAASILEKLIDDPSLENMATVQASLTMLREVILNAYGLSKEDLLITDYDDFVEFVVNEANEEDK